MPHRRKRVATLLSLVAALLACAPRVTTNGATRQPMAKAPTLVAIFAHPDDETLVAPVLARYAREGARVFLVIATDGRLGTEKHAAIPAGDSLATVRAGEARCSAGALGLQPAILLGFPDAGLAEFRPFPGGPLNPLAIRIDSVLRALQPTAVITWGPEGGYGHSDHRLTGNVVVQLFQSGAVSAGTPLYHAGFPVERTASGPPWYGMRLFPVSADLLTATISYSPADREAAARSVACHWSQATVETQRLNLQALDHLWQGTVTFQQWRGGRKRTSLL